MWWRKNYKYPQSTMLIFYFIIKYFAATEFDCEIGFRVDQGERTCTHERTHARTHARMPTTYWLH